MTQQALDVGDGLFPPFWAKSYRYSVEQRREDDDLYDLLGVLDWGEADGQHHVTEIGDAKGRLWYRERITWRAEERAPWGPNPYSVLESQA